MRSIRKRGAGHFGLKKLHLKNRWNLLKFTLFYDFQREHFIDFLSAIFYSPKCPVIPISYTSGVHWKHFYQLLSTIIKIYQFLPLLTDFCTNLTNFYHFLPPSINFYYLPSTFTNFLPSPTKFYYLPLTFTKFSQTFTNILSALPIFMLLMLLLNIVVDKIDHYL